MSTFDTCVSGLLFKLRAALGAMVFLAALASGLASSHADETAAWNALERGAIVLFRHSNAPGVGDPPGFSLDDCSTQRNLDDEGRAQAKRINDTFRERGIAVGKVITSQWCRTRDTANIVFPGMVQDEPSFNSFFGDRTGETEQTASAAKLLISWKGPGALVIVTHQVNITALTGVAPASGEGIVLSNAGGQIAIVGRIRP
jgi:phosphohistidine phosphatase SixA